MLKGRKRARRRVTHSGARGRVPENQALRWWFLVVVVVVLFSFWINFAYYAVQKYVNSWPLSTIEVSVVAPMYLSANEEEEIRFSVESSQDTNIDVTFRAANGGPFLGFIGTSGNNDFYSGPVKSREQINRQLKVFFPFDRVKPNSTRSKVAGLSIWGSVGNAPTQLIADLPIRIAPIPRIKWVSDYLGAALAALVLWLSKELWDQAKSSGKEKR